jgi:hypothetical protein
MKRMRKTQEEEIIAVLKREGFQEVSEEEINQSPHKYFFEFPDCIKKTTAKASNQPKRKAHPHP